MRAPTKMLRLAPSHAFRRRIGRAALMGGAATMAITLGATRAAAECAPDAHGTIVCAGTSTTLSHNGSADIVVLPGAEVREAGAPGSNNAIYLVDSSGTIQVDGLVRSSSGYGVLYEDADGPIRVTIGREGSIRGTTAGLAMLGGYPDVVIDNSGVIAGETGVSLSGSVYLEKLTNRAGGRIAGGIAVDAFGVIENDGIIDGGLNRGIYGSEGHVVNRGLITSSGDDSALRAGETLVNSGTIQNTFSGPAVSSAELGYRVQNLAGGIVRADTEAFNLATGEIDNAGSIAGDVVFAGRSDGTEDSSLFVQRLGGTVAGDVRFGANNDMFYFEAAGDTVLDAAAARVTTRSGGVGNIDGGAGFDTFTVGMTQSGTVTLGGLPTGFERFGVDLCGCDVTVTIAGTGNAPLKLGGSGTVVLGADAVLDYSGNQLALELGTFGDGAGTVSFVNKGTIKAAGVYPAQTLISADQHAGFVNEGTIALAGEYGTGLAIDYATPVFGPNGFTLTGFENKGTITASNEADEHAVALSLRAVSSNSGTISATGELLTAVESMLSIDNSGTIEADGVALRLSGELINSGTIVSRLGNAVEVGRYESANIVNQAGATISGATNAIYAADDASDVAIVNRGRIMGNVDLTGTAGNDIFWAAEGSHVEGDVLLGRGDNTLAFDVSRYHQDGTFDLTGLVSGDVSPGSDTNNRLQLVATESKAVDILPLNSPVFGRLIYDAYGIGTTLTLNAPVDAQGNPETLAEALRVTGNGTVQVNADFDMSGRGGYALYAGVDKGMAGAFDDPEGRYTPVNVVVTGAMRGAYDGSILLGNANLRLASSARIEAAGGNAIFTDGYSATAITLDKGAEIHLLASNRAKYAIAGEISPMTIVNAGRIFEDAISGPTDGTTLGYGVSMYFSSLTNLADGVISVMGTGIQAGAGSLIDNRGLIESGYSAAVAFTDYFGFDVGGTLVNSGRLRGFTLGAIGGVFGATVQGSSYSDTVDNSGTIEGSVALRNGDDIYRALGGTVSGDVDLGGGNNTFLVLDGKQAGVSGAILAAGNHDAFGTSFDTSGTLSLPGISLPTDFEMYAAEARGENVRVTLTGGTEPLSRGVRLLGSGTIVNNVAIALGGVSTGEEIAIEAKGALALENNAVISSVYAGVFDEGLRSFVNNGSITGAAGAYGRSAETFGEGFLFTNKGTMTATEGTGVRLYVGAISSDETGEIVALDFLNSGKIAGDGEGSDGVEAFSDRGVMKLVNAAGGEITATGAFAYGFDLFGEDRVELHNAGLVEASGNRATAIAIASARGGDAEDCPPGETPLAIDLQNAGIVRANQGSVATAISLESRADHSLIRFVNAASGLVEATGNAGTALAVCAVGEYSCGSNGGYGEVDVDAALRFFEMTNAGTITGNGSFESAAIFSTNLTDTIVNQATGVINGDVELNAGDDSFTNMGTLNGDLDMGAGDDSFVYYASGTMNGTAYGGEGTDTLTVDLSGRGLIDFDLFRQFEVLRQRGTGTVTIKGTTDLATLNIAASHVTVDEGTTFQSASDLALQGSDEAETLDIFGSVRGNVDLGGGDDVVNLAATGSILTRSGVDGVLSTGAGNDKVIALGALQGIDLGAGNDELLLRSGGRLSQGVHAGAGNDLVTVDVEVDGQVFLEDGDDKLVLTDKYTGAKGTIDGGAGTDTVAFALTTDSSVVPSGLSSFEILEASGAHRLTLTPGQRYEEVVLKDGADLTLNAGDPLFSVGKITGDDSDNDVVLGVPLTGGVSLGGGADKLSMSLGGTLSNELDGGAGADTLALSLTGDSTIGGSIKGFENINIAGSAKLTLVGDFAAGQTMTFDANDNHLSVTAGGALYGSVDGGAGNGDRLSFDTVAGATTSLGAGTISNFEIFEVTGDGTLQLTANRAFTTLEMNQGNLQLAKDVVFTGGVTFGASSNVLTLESGARISGTADGGAGIDRLQLNQAAGDTRKLSDVLGSVVNFEQLGVGGAGTLRIDVDQTYSGGVVMSGGTLDMAAGRTLTADLSGEGESNDTLILGGTIAGRVDLGAGNDRLVLQGGTATGGIDGGAGIDTVAFSITRDETGIPNVSNFENLDVSGDHRLTIGLDQDFQTIFLNGGADLTLNQGSGDHAIGSIVGDASDQDVVINTKLTGSVDLGGGNDKLTIQLEGALGGGLNGGAGDDTLNLNLTGAASINGGAQGFEHINVAGGAPLTLGGEFGAGQTMQFDAGDNTLIIAAGASVLGSIDGGAGTDTLGFSTIADQTTVLGGQITGFEIVTASGAGTVAVNGDASFDRLAINGGDLAIGGGATLTAPTVAFDAADNRFTIGENATFNGLADGGAGSDRLVLNQAASQIRKMSSVNATGFEQLETGGAGELAFDVDAGFDTVDMLGGKLSIAAGKTLTAPVFNGGDGANVLDVRGTLSGNVNLGGGDDRLIVASAGSVTGTRAGGLGTDTLEFATAGTNAAPASWNGSGFEGFERLQVSSGVVSLTGDIAYDNVSVTGGRLIGQAGTTITSATTIQVAQGATFGTAGTVKGNIQVLGTLAPGASPGTMTVQGDVAFEAGSTLAMEVASPVSDKLVISGKLAIANGARMDITGILQAGAGAGLDLVVADGGITGMFTTINKSDTIFGYVVKRDNKIQIAGTFAGVGDLPYNAAQAVTYGNATVSAGQMVQAFTAGLPVLVNADGTARQAGFQQLGPEAYASAAQLSVDAGLAIADTSRNLKTPAGIRGWFGLASGFASWGKLGAQTATGATGAQDSVNGFLGGIGYGFDETARLGAFVATQRGRQTLGALGATTKADGFVLGAFAEARIGGIDVKAMGAYDLSDARTARRIDAASGESAVGKYGLGGLTLDLSASRSFDLGSFELTPRLGTTFVEGKREGVVEAGTPFALHSAGTRQNAWFGDAGIKVAGKLGAIQPYAEVGVRHRFDDGTSFVEAAMNGSTVTPLIGAYGVQRDRTAARLGAGVGADLADNVRVSVGYLGEIGKDSRHSANAGISIGF